MSTVKCVVWDLDGTVWPGVAIESDTAPTPFPAALKAMDALESRGIVNSLASRTDPSILAVVKAEPGLADRFVAPQLSWGHKSEAICRIAGSLGIALSAVAFVDDNPFERAEVAAVLPEVLVLSPDELYAQLDTPLFAPGVLTDDARARPARYKENERREEAGQAFEGTREAFLRDSRIVLTVGAAGPADVERVVELVERTHRFNSTGEHWSAERASAVIGDPGWLVATARLTDRFGDYGMIGVGIIERAPSAWRLRLFTVSCRAAGRDAPVAFLGWLSARARAAGAGTVQVDLRASEANLEVRVLLRACGFEAVGEPLDGAVVLSRDTHLDLPAVPWLAVSTGAASSGGSSG